MRPQDVQWTAAHFKWILRDPKLLLCGPALEAAISVARRPSVRLSRRASDLLKQENRISFKFSWTIGLDRIGVDGEQIRGQRVKGRGR